MAARFGQLTARLLSAANSANATLVLDRPGIITHIEGWNAAAVTYLKLYDKATAPDSSDTPRRTIYLPASAKFDFDFANPLSFAAGIGYRLVTGNADNDNTSVAAAAILAMNIDYA